VLHHVLTLHAGAGRPECNVTAESRPAHNFYVKYCGQRTKMPHGSHDAVRRRIFMLAAIISIRSFFLHFLL
jgi:hypothetical protein